MQRPIPSVSEVVFISISCHSHSQGYAVVHRSGMFLQTVRQAVVVS